ncbi:MAG: hypothetical protein P4M11_04690 [Candidatus Pacebacteria bacterium]|nr:hypothetical protein [Candidatus Paceibacterota bacterium]
MTIEVLNTITGLAGAVLYAVKYYMMPDTQYWFFTILTYLCMLEMNVYCCIRFLGRGNAYLQYGWNRYFCAPEMVDLTCSSCSAATSAFSSRLKRSPKFLSRLALPSD